MTQLLGGEINAETEREAAAHPDVGNVRPSPGGAAGGAWHSPAAGPA